VLTQRVDALKLQIPLQKSMEAALEADSLDQLEDCMAVMKKQGLWSKPEDWVQELKAMELPGRIFDALGRAKAAKKKVDDDAKRRAEIDKNVLQQDARHGDAFVVDQEAIDAAKEKEEKEKKRQTRIGLMKLSAKEEKEVLAELAAAVTDFDGEELEAKLSYATVSGMDPEDLQTFQALFDQLQSETFLDDKIKELMAKIATCEAAPKAASNRKTCNVDEDGNAIAEEQPAAGAETQHAPDTQTLKVLKNLCAQAERIGAPVEIYKDAKPAIQTGLRRRAKSTLNGSVFNQLDLGELSMCEDSFSDIRDFENIKAEAKWEGHRRDGFLGMVKAANMNKEKMHSHSKCDINAPLTVMPRAHSRAAVQNFRNLLVWMGDRPAPEVQRRGYAHSILDLAKSDPALTDEIYVQVMKQLTDNPSTKSMHFGWSLLLLLCQGAAPSDELEEFVRSFMLRTLHADPDEGEKDQEVLVFAKQCIADLNVTIKSQESKNEGETSKEIIPVQVMLIDSSARKVNIIKSSTLGQLGVQVAEQLHVSSAKEFSFFQMIEGVDAHRLLPDSIPISTLLPKWETLLTTTGKKSRLLWKRRFLCVDESLRPHELMHAKLTYQQALWDYLHYPISEDLGFIYKVAAMVLFIDRDHFRKYIAEKNLHEPGVLELLLPEYVLRFEKREKLGASVLKAFQILQGAACNPDSQGSGLPASRLVRMSQAFQLFQRMRLFGTYCWSCKQTYRVPQEKVSLPEAPDQMCKINPKDPEAEYWICVDLFGVRFLSLDSTPGHEYPRGFLFRDESVERILRWSAKQDILSLIVQTYAQQDQAGQTGRTPAGKPVAAPAGRLPMSIAVTCPAAVDIAHTLQCVARQRAQG